MTIMPKLPIDEGFVRLGHTAEVATRTSGDTTADDMMDAFKCAIFTGE